MDDVVAVMDAAGSERAAVFAQLEGGAMATLFAATHPERTTALVLYEAMPRMSWAPDYDWAPTRRGAQACRDGGLATGATARASSGWRPEVRRRTRGCASGSPGSSGSPRVPGTAAKLMMMNARGRRPRGAADDPGADARPPPRARTSSSTSATRATSPSTFPGARYVELPGEEAISFGADSALAARRDRGVPHRRAPRRRRRADPRDRDVLRHRRLDAARRGARRPALARPARVDRVGGRARADALPRPRGQDDGRRLPRDVRRPRPRDSLRDRDQGRRPRPSSGSRSAAACTPARSR